MSRRLPVADSQNRVPSGVPILECRMNPPGVIKIHRMLPLETGGGKSTDSLILMSLILFPQIKLSGFPGDNRVFPACRRNTIRQFSGEDTPDEVLHVLLRDTTVVKDGQILQLGKRFRNRKPGCLRQSRSPFRIRQRAGCRGEPPTALPLQI